MRGIYLPVEHAGFISGRGTRDQIANLRWIIEKVREFLKPLFMCFIDYSKASHCVDHPRLWNILGMGITEHITALLQNLSTSQEATVRTEVGLTKWFTTGTNY